jgi:hypothetical protein
MSVWKALKSLCCTFIGEAQNSYDIQISTRLVVDNNSIQNQNQKVLFKVGTFYNSTT